MDLEGVSDRTDLTCFACFRDGFVISSLGVVTLNWGVVMLKLGCGYVTMRVWLCQNGGVVILYLGGYIKFGCGYIKLGCGYIKLGCGYIKLYLSYVKMVWLY